MHSRVLAAVVLSAISMAESGYFTPRLSAQESNDECVNAFSFRIGVDGMATASGNTKGLTPDEETLTCGNSNAPGAWYTVEGNGAEMTATTCNAITDYDTRLRVFSGSCLSPPPLALCHAK